MIPCHLSRHCALLSRQVGQAPLPCAQDAIFSGSQKTDCREVVPCTQEEGTQRQVLRSMHRASVLSSRQTQSGVPHSPLYKDTF